MTGLLRWAGERVRAAALTPVARQDILFEEMKLLNSAIEDIYNGADSRKARALLPIELHGKAARLLDRLAAAHELRDLSAPGLRLEKLAGKRDGHYSLRINDQYRVCFRWVNGEAVDVEITDYH